MIEPGRVMMIDPEATDAIRYAADTIKDAVEGVALDIKEAFTTSHHGHEPFGMADTTDYIGDGLNRIAMALERIASAMEKGGE